MILAEYEQIEARSRYGANDIRPGLTGWAQINGRDAVTVEEKARLDGWQYASSSRSLHCWQPSPQIWVYSDFIGCHYVSFERPLCLRRHRRRGPGMADCVESVGVGQASRDSFGG